MNGVEEVSLGRFGRDEMPGLVPDVKAAMESVNGVEDAEEVDLKIKFRKRERCGGCPRRSCRDVAAGSQGWERTCGRMGKWKSDVQS